MVKNTFSIKTDLENVVFICNKETGDWLITNNEEKYNLNSNNTFSTQPFTGTCMIALNMGRRCNLNCIYCLVGNLKKKKESLKYNVGKRVIESIAELNKNDKHIVFHGSEPLANIEMIYELIEYAKKLDKEIRFSIQTNGTLFDDNIISYFYQNDVNIGISLDGKEYHQNKNRPYLSGDGSFEKVIKNVEKITKIQNGLSIITVLTKYNISDLEEIVEYYESLNLHSVLFTPANPFDDISFVPPEDVLIQKVIKIFDRYLQLTMEGKETIQIIKFKKILSTFFRQKTTSNCLQCGAGPKHPLLAVDIDGTIYPCDYLWDKKEYSIGNILVDSLSDVINSNKNFRKYRNVDNIVQCDNCNWKRFCGGGCPGSLIAAGRGLENESFYCNYNKELFKYMAKKNTSYS